MSIVTDAFKEGWKSHRKVLVISGTWSLRHTNWRELQAVWLMMQHFLPQLQGAAMDVFSDSIMVDNINNEGGTQPPSLCCLREKPLRGHRPFAQRCFSVAVAAKASVLPWRDYSTHKWEGDVYIRHSCCHLVSGPVILFGVESNSLPYLCSKANPFYGLVILKRASPLG